jgi:hypothetical protein
MRSTATVWRFRSLSLFLVAVVAAAVASFSEPSQALVGGSADDRFANRTVMILNRDAQKSGFCSALVLGPRLLLTAAHCLRPVGDMVVLYRSPAGEPVVVPVAAARAHPLYRPDAARLRIVSIDLALVATAKPLDASFVAAELGDGEAPGIGEDVVLSGYGLTQEGEPHSGGKLSSLTLRVREPASKILLWAADLGNARAGACAGDSGGPIWSADGARAIAIIAWSQGEHGGHCGVLTQGPLIAPQRDWIERTAAQLTRSE